MKRSVLLLIGLAGVLGASPASAAHHRRHHRKPTCATAGHTVLATAHVRIYKHAYKLEDQTLTGWFVCWLPRHRKHFLGDDSDCSFPGGRVLGVKVRGRLVAYRDLTCDGSAPGSEDLNVTDARTGRARAAVLTGGGQPGGFLDFQFVGGHGVAWLQQQFDAGGEPVPGTISVRALDPLPCRSAASSCPLYIGTLLDDAPGIESGSLAASGSRIYWTRSGLPRGAPAGGLPGTPFVPLA